MARNVNGTENNEHRTIIIILPLALFSVPVRNDDRVIGELSRGNKLVDGFLDRSRWVELLQEKTLKGK